jgi:HAD superfamily hydrolase (TIGR01509 family)
MIKGIFFDAAGVLYTRGGPTEAFALSLLQELGFPTTPSAQDLERQKALRSQASQGQLSHEAYWDEFLRMRGVASPDQRQALIKQITDYSNDVIPVSGNREALADLKQRGFVLGIVTDTMYPLEWKVRRLEKAGVAEFIDVIACSTVLGVHKPDPAMYLNAVQQAHLTPGESAFVGHATIELEGARRAGMKTVAVNHDPDAQADYYAQSLLDLLNVPIFQKTNGLPKGDPC